MSRSGVEPPTGTIHPRESRGATDGKQNQLKNSFRGDAFPVLELRASIWRGWSFPSLCRSGVEPPTGTIHPRESSGTTDGKQNQLKDSFRGDAFPVLELRASIWRGWSFPVGGSTPDRLKCRLKGRLKDQSKTGSRRRSGNFFLQICIFPPKGDIIPPETFPPLAEKPVRNPKTWRET